MQNVLWEGEKGGSVRKETRRERERKREEKRKRRTFSFAHLEASSTSTSRSSSISCLFPTRTTWRCGDARARASASQRGRERNVDRLSGDVEDSGSRKMRDKKGVRKKEGSLAKLLETAVQECEEERRREIEVQSDAMKRRPSVLTKREEKKNEPCNVIDQYSSCCTTIVGPCY